MERYVQYHSFPIRIPDRLRYASWVAVVFYFWVLGVLIYFGAKHRRTIA